MRRVAEGRTALEVARFLGVHERTVRGWYNRYLQGGEAALAAKPRPASPRSKLTAQQEAQVLGWLECSPTEEEFGFPTELWTAARVAQRIHQRFGVRYHPGHLLRWLRARGVTPQRVRRRPRGHDAGEMQRWLGEQWPRILKKRPSRRPVSC